LRANPEAFVDNNINNLKTGHVLRVPERDNLTSISDAAAKREASAQYAAWRQARADSKTAKQSTKSSKQADAGGADEGSKLQLVAADLDGANAGTVDRSGEQGTVNGLKRDLVLANEALEAQRSEGKEMTNRLSVLEEQIQNMQRLIQLKDDELARMQSNVGSELTSAESTESIPNGATDLGPAGVSDLEMELDPSESIPSLEAGQEPDVMSVPVDDVDVVDTVAEPAVETDSFFKTLTDSLMQNPLWLGLGAALLALLAFFGLRGRRSTDTEFQESILQSSSRISDEHLTDFSETQVRSADLHDSSLSEFAVSDMADSVDNNEANPVAEADVYLAYGRFQQAEELLKEALSNDPDNEELNLKLLGVYEASGNTDGFDNHARDILTHLGDHEHPMWKKVAAMGLVLCPNNPIYNPDGSTSANASESVVSDLPTIDDVPEIVADNTVEFTADKIEAKSTGNSDATNVTADGKLTDLDEISTKLDLARAYIDMGDPEGARNILSEVIEEGNDDQRNEANGILEKLAS
jgi:pilus assembly protein FimV